MKTCSKCNGSKPLSDFHAFKRSKDGHQSICKSCMKIAYRKCRKQKHKHYRAVQLARENRNRDRFIDWKKEQSCMQCGMNNYVCLELHHRDPKEKDIDVSDACRSWAWKRLAKELQKCDILCANCHRIEHHKRRNLV